MKGKESTLDVFLQFSIEWKNYGVDQKQFSIYEFIGKKCK